jgi:hypothetical protein
MIKWVQLAFRYQSVKEFVAAGISLVSNAIHVYFQEKAFLFILLCNCELAMSLKHKMRRFPK